MAEPFAHDIRLRNAVALIAVLLAVIGLVIGVVIFLVHHWDLGADPGAHDRSMQLRPTSHLETAPQPELQAYLDEKRRLASGYAWLDRDRGIARIPLELAMRAMVEEAQARRKGPAQ